MSANPIRIVSTEKKRRTYSVLVQNEPGVLSRIAGLFSARGYNIVSLAVGETLDPTVSRMTIVSEGTETVLDQIRKQLDRLIPVLDVKDLHETDCVSRELLLIKIDKTAEARKYLQDNWLKHNWQIIDESPEHLIVQIVASREESEKVLAELRPFNISEMSRTGQVAMSKKYKIGLEDIPQPQTGKAK